MRRTAKALEQIVAEGRHIFICIGHVKQKCLIIIVLTSVKPEIISCNIIVHPAVYKRCQRFLYSTHPAAVHNGDFPFFEQTALLKIFHYIMIIVFGIIFYFTKQSGIIFYFLAKCGIFTVAEVFIFVIRKTDFFVNLCTLTVIKSCSL